MKFSITPPLKGKPKPHSPAIQYPILGIMFQIGEGSCLKWDYLRNGNPVGPTPSDQLTTLITKKTR